MEVLWGLVHYTKPGTQQTKATKEPPLSEHWPIEIKYQHEGVAEEAWKQINSTLEKQVPCITWSIDDVINTITVTGQLVAMWKPTSPDRYILHIIGYYVEYRPYKGARLKLGWGIAGKSTEEFSIDQLNDKIVVPVSLRQIGLGEDLDFDSTIQFNHGAIESRDFQVLSEGTLIATVYLDKH